MPPLIPAAQTDSAADSCRGFKGFANCFQTSSANYLPKSFANCFRRNFCGLFAELFPERVLIVRHPLLLSRGLTRACACPFFMSYTNSHSLYF